MSFTERFTSYFNRDVAKLAAKSIGNDAEIEIRVGDEALTFTKKSGENTVLPGPARDPQLVFTLAPRAAEAILSHPSDDIADIGVQIAKLVISKDPEQRVSVQFKAGFLTLFTKGYFGVLTVGGARFASFLASQGLSGITAIKAFLAKSR